MTGVHEAGLMGPIALAAALHTLLSPRLSFTTELDVITGVVQKL